MKLDITQPCDQDFLQMQSVGKNRFCAVCEKKVIDFTRLTDAELIAFFSQQSGNVCGRLRADQMGINLHKGNGPKRSAALPAFLLGLSLVVNSSDAEAQLPQRNTVSTPRSFRNPIPLISGSVLQEITGSITDSAGAAIPTAAIRLISSSIGAVSDVNGHFSLKIPDSLQRTYVQLQVNAVSYQSQLVSVAIHRSHVVVTLEPVPTARLGKICVVGGVIVRKTFWQHFLGWFK